MSEFRAKMGPWATKNSGPSILTTGSNPGTSKTPTICVSSKSNEFDKWTQKMPLLWVRAFSQIWTCPKFSQRTVSLCKIRRSTQWRRRRAGMIHCFQVMPKFGDKCSPEQPKMVPTTNFDDGFDFRDCGLWWFSFIWVGSGWSVVVLGDLSWVCVISDGSVWSVIDLLDRSWFCVIWAGPVWSVSALHDLSWFCVIWNDSVWSELVLRDLSWFYII